MEKDGDAPDVVLFPVKISNNNGSSESDTSPTSTLTSSKAKYFKSFASNSNSVPNTSLITSIMDKNETLVSQNPFFVNVIVDSEPYGKRVSSSTLESNLKPNLGNSDLSDLDNANDNQISTQPTMVSLQPSEDRAHRVDVLWKVKDDEPPNLEASVSNCTVQIKGQGIKFQKQTRVIFPNFNEKTFLEDRNHTSLSQNQIDPNDNEIRVAEKKSDEGQVIDVERIGHQDIRRPTGFEPLAKRENFNWPWHSGVYHINFRFQNQEFRTLFSCKMFLLKAVQWIFALIWTLLAKHIGYSKDKDIMLSLYFTTFILFGAYLAVRSTNLLESQPTSCIVMMIYCLSIAHITGTLYTYYNNPMVPIIILTLVFTFSTVGVFLVCLKIDSQSPLVFYPLVVIVVISSISAFWIIFEIRGDRMDHIIFLLASFWLPSLVFALIIASAEMSEIQSLLQGSRLPLEPRDWLVASTFIL